MKLAIVLTLSVIGLLAAHQSAADIDMRGFEDQSDPTPTATPCPQPTPCPESLPSIGDFLAGFVIGISIGVVLALLFHLMFFIKRRLAT